MLRPKVNPPRYLFMRFMKSTDQHLSIGVPYKDILFAFIKFYKKTICLGGRGLRDLNIILSSTVG